MNQNKISNIFSLSSEDRYWYFIRKVADFEEVWLIKGEGKFVTLGNNLDDRSIPVWPEKEFAELMLTDTWEGFEVEQKPLNDFVEWLVQLKRDNIKVAVFPRADLHAVVIPPDGIKEHLLEELEQYE